MSVCAIGNHALPAVIRGGQQLGHSLFLVVG